MDYDKPNRLVTPWLVRTLSVMGYTNLTEEDQKWYEAFYRQHYPKSTVRSAKKDISDLTQK